MVEFKMGFTVETTSRARPACQRARVKGWPVLMQT